MNKAKVCIPDPKTGTAREMEGDVAYGCIMNRKDRDGKLGIDCKSFLVSGNGTIPVINMAEPMAASICLALEKAAGGNAELELSCLEIMDRYITERGRAIMGGGGQDAGTEH